MEPLLVDTFQNIIDDTLTFSTVCYHFLHYNVPKRHLSEVCALLLEGDDSWESWLFENAPSELLKRLHENPLGLVLPPEVSYDNEDYEPSTITAFINHIRVMSLSVACDLAMLPFWALKVNHIAGTFRTEELAELVKSNMDKSSAANKDSVLPFMPFMVASRSANIFEQLSAMYATPPLLSSLLRGSVAICALGLLRNYSAILAREDECQSNAPTFSYTLEDTGGLETTNRDSKDRIKSMALLHDGKHSQRSTGRPTPQGGRRLTPRRASGNVFYESKDDLELTESEWAKLPFVQQTRDAPSQISMVARGLIAVLLHPLELIAVRQVTSSSAEYATLLSSVATIYNETAGGSLKNFFWGWRSTIINCIFLPKGGWFMMGIPYLVRVRRMLPAQKGGEGGGDGEGVEGGVGAGLAATESLAAGLGVEKIGKSLEILRAILSPGGGGISALLAGAEVNVRALVPSFFCLFAARIAVHAVFGRSEKARVRRVRRDAFVRMFFEKAKRAEESKP